MVNFKFEIKKILRGKKILIAIFLSLLISSVLFIGNYMNQYKISGRIIEDYYPWYEKLISESESFTVRMDEKGISDKDKKEYLKPNEKLQIALLELFQLADTKNMEEIPDKILELYDEYEEYSKRAIKKTLGVSDIRLNADKEYYMYLSKNKLSYEDTEYSITGANFVKTVVNRIYGLPLALLLILLCVDIFSGENMNGTENIRKIQPVKRVNIIYSKLFASFLYSIFFLLSLIISSYLIGGIFGNGFGTFSYPVQRGPQILTASKDSIVLFELISIGKYILLSTVYFGAYILFILGVVSFSSVIFKDTLLVSVISVILVSIAHLVSTKFIDTGKWIQGIMPNYPIFNPFAYEFSNRMIQDLRLKPLAIMWIPIIMTLIIVYLSYILSRNSYIQTMFKGRRIKDGETSLKEYENKNHIGKFVNFRFEILKIFRKKEVYITTIIIISMVSVYGYNSSKEYKRIYQDREDFYNWRLENLDEALNYFTEGDMHNKLKADYEKYIKFKKAYENNDRDIISDSMISAIYENQEQAIGFMGYSDKGFSLETIMINISEIEEVKERNVEPPLPYAYEVKSTPFDKFRTMADYLRYMDYSKRYQPSITYIINGIFKNGLNYLILLVLTIALATGFIAEREKNHTLRLMNIQPIKSKNIYLGKLFAQIIVFVSIIILSLGILFAGLLISGKKVEANYPVIRYENKIDENYQGEKLLRRNLAVNKKQEPIEVGSNQFVGYEFRDMSKENIEMIIIFIIIGIMSLGFAMLISLNIKNRWLISIMTILVFVLGYGFSMGILKGISLGLPFIWLNQALVSSGEANIIFDTNFINVKLGVAILALWIVITVFLGVKKYNKKYGRG